MRSIALFGAIPPPAALIEVAGVIKKVKDAINDMAAVTNGVPKGASDDAGVANAPAKTFDTILVLDFGYA